MSEEQEQFMRDICDYMLDRGYSEYEAYDLACFVWENKKWLKEYLNET